MVVQQAQNLYRVQYWAMTNSVWPGSHMSGIWDGGGSSGGLNLMRMWWEHGPAQRRWSHWSLVDPCCRQYSTANMMPSLVTTIGHPTRKPCMHRLAILQGHAANIIGALKGYYGNHQLVVAYWSQLKASIQLSGKSLQEFAATSEQMAHWTLVGLLVVD